MLIFTDIKFSHPCLSTTSAMSMASCGFILSCTSILYFILHYQIPKCCERLWSKVNEISVSCGQGQASELTHSNQFYLTPEDQKHHRRILPGVGAAAMLLPLPELLWGTSAHYSITDKTEEVLPAFSMLAWVTSKLHTHCLSSAK